MTFIGQLDGAQWSVSIYDFTADAWVPAGTLTGSEYTRHSNIRSMPFLSVSRASSIVDLTGDRLVTSACVCVITCLLNRFGFVSPAPTVVAEEFSRPYLSFM